MVRSRWSVGLLLLMLCAVVLSACGGKSEADQKADYKKDAKAISDQAKQSLQTLQSRLSGKSDAQQLQEIDKTRTDVISAADRLDKLDPPDDVKSEHDQFVSALRQFGEDIKPVEDAAKAKDKQAAQQALQKLQTDAGNLKTTGDALDAKLK
jgi:hypothetical protein